MGCYGDDGTEALVKKWRNLFTCHGGTALDALGWLLALYAAAVRLLSMTFTVRWDPLGYSREPVPFYSTKGAFTVGALAGSNERERRIVAWFYRWHETPDDDDWRACLALFGLPACPAHTLRLVGVSSPKVVEVIEIRLGEGPGRGGRTVSVAATDFWRAGARVTGPTPLGGLSPARLVRDASE